jgi:hypothetical protein
MDRRTFLYGLAGGVAGGYAMSFLINPFAFGAAESITEYVANTGATTPFYGNAVYPPALYDGDKTWIGWEAWNGSQRVTRVTSLDHDTGYFSDIIEAGFSSLVDDDHGNPALCLDDEGYLHVFHGSHHSDQLYSSTRWAVTGSPGEGSMWAIRPPLTAAEGYTYPHPVLVGSDIHLLLRKRTTASTKMELVHYKTSSLVAGVATWGSETVLVNLGADSIFYMGTALKSGTDIWIVATKADFLDNTRKNVYLFVYDTATGAVKNHDGSASVASGSLPVDLAEADADFRLFEHTGGNEEGGIPVLCFDSNGDPHVAFKDGTGTSYAIKHIKRTAGTWDAPVTVATGDNRFANIALVPVGSAAVELYYTLDPGSDWDRGGDIMRRVRSSGGVWGTAQTILNADSHALGSPAMVLDGHGDARVVFCERTEGTTDAEAGDLKIFAYGNGGLIAYAADPGTPASSGETLQLNGENLQLNSEDLTLGT